MLYQQINDLAITGHNWLWNKGYNILSVSLQLVNSLSSSLLLVLTENSTCPVFAPSSYSPFPPVLPLSISLEWTNAPSFPLSSERGIWKTGSVSASLHHIQSSRCLFSSPPFPPSLHLPFSLLLCHPPPSPSSLCLSSKPPASLITVIHLSISIYLSPIVFFTTILPLLDAFSSYISSLPQSVFVLEDAVPFVLSEDGVCNR